MLHRGGSEHLANEQHRQPARALADHLRQRGLHIRLVNRLHTTKLLCVFRLLFLDDVDGIVDRDDAKQSPLAINDRQGDEVIIGNDLRHFFLQHIRRYAHHFTPRDISDASTLGGGQQFAQRQHAPQTTVHIGRVDRVHRFTTTGTRHRSHGAQRFFHRELLVDRHELGGHETTGSVRVVLEQSLGLGLCFRAEFRENVVGGFFVEFFECVGALVRRHLGDDRRCLAGRQLFEKLGAQLFVEILEHFGGALFRQGKKERTHHLLRHRFSDVGEVRRVHLFGLRTDALRRFLEELEEIGYEQRRERPFFV